MTFGRAGIAMAFLVGCAVPLVGEPGAMVELHHVGVHRGRSGSHPDAGVAVAAAPVISVGSSSLCGPPADTVEPAVTRVTFGKSSIDLNSGSRVQTIRVTASDTSGHGAGSGVVRVQVIVGYVHSLELKLTSGTATSGQWTGKFDVSRDYPRPTYPVQQLDVYDAAGNRHLYQAAVDKLAGNTSALSLIPADNPTYSVTGERRPNENPGRLTSFTLSRTTVNPTRSVQRVRARATFAGIEPTGVELLVDTLPGNRPDVHDLNLTVAMERRHGVWSGVVEVPPGIGSQVLRPTITGTFGPSTGDAERAYDWPQLRDRGFPSKITVVTVRDTTAPHITSLNVVRHPMTKDGAMRVTVTAKATDTGSGVQGIGLKGYIRRGVNGVRTGDYYLNGYGAMEHYFFRAALTKTAGNTWVGDVTFRPCVPSGTYGLIFSVSDYAGNFSTEIRRRVEVNTKHGDTYAPWVHKFTYDATTLRLKFTEGVANVNTSTLTLYRLYPYQTRYQTSTKITKITCTHGAVRVACDGSDPKGLVESATLTVPDFRSSYDRGYRLFANQHQVTPQLVDGNGNPMSPDQSPDNPAA